MRLISIFEIDDPGFKDRLLFWAGTRTIACALNSNRERQLFKDPYSVIDFIVAADSVSEISFSENQVSNLFDSAKEFYDSKKDWLFGFFTYDLKNDPAHPGEKLKSENFDGLNFPMIHFFQPRFVFKIAGSKLEVHYLAGNDSEFTIQEVVTEISSLEIPVDEGFDIEVRPRVSKEEYIASVIKIKEHIKRGNVYELNYCMEFFSGDASLNPVHTYKKLNDLSPMPFSGFYRTQDHYLMCASPERFVAKREDTIISQPMKGTARRGMNREEDEIIKMQFKNDAKEQTENVMIVDLVRNDLSRTAKKGSVHVEELFGVYPFQQLHQMISTVVSEKSEKFHWMDVIKNMFPMGSMTGAPKIKAMQLIEQFEKTKRGLYSGSMGYVSPEGNFDFNVVIRSLLYHSQKKYLSFMVGSAITANSVVENEYNECLLKAAALLKVLSASSKRSLQVDS